MRIAVIGGGISGMLAARLLCRAHEVQVFEAGSYVGGHTNAIDVTAYGRQFRVDTGFMVFNQRTYPNFVRMLKALGVSWQASDMSFSVRVERTGLEYNGTSLNTLFAQRRNLLRPSFYRLLAEIVRFNRAARAIAEVSLEPATDASPQNLQEFLQQHRFSRALAENYLVPMTAAIWSCPPQDVYQFPILFLARFFANHGLLDLADRPQWFTIAGSSRRYVEALTEPYRDRIRLNSSVRKIERDAFGAQVTLCSGETERFEAIVLATHANTSLGLLADATPNETQILSGFRYQPNEAIVHTDPRLLPRRKRAWASWNSHVFDDPTRPAAVTYYLNRLQNLDAPSPICVTLGNADQINPACILRRIVYHHPVYSHTAIAAQKRWTEINGPITFFCGAYWGNGFHEDGVNSSLAVARKFNITLDELEIQCHNNSALKNTPGSKDALSGVLVSSPSL